MSRLMSERETMSEGDAVGRPEKRGLFEVQWCEAHRNEAWPDDRGFPRCIGGSWIEEAGAWDCSVGAALVVLLNERKEMSNNMVVKMRVDADERIEQMMRVFTVLHEKGLSFTDSMDVLRAFYNVEPTIKEAHHE